MLVWIPPRCVPSLESLALVKKERQDMSKAGVKLKVPSLTNEEREV